MQSQASEKGADELIARVREAAQELDAAARAIPAGRLEDVAPSEQQTGGSWTPLDCLHHAMGSNMSVAREVLYAAHTGELPPEEQDELPRDVEQLVQLHDQAMESCYVHVQDADPSAFLDVTWTHPMFGELNWREWFLFMRIHSKDHARQLTAMAESWGNS